MSTRLTLLFEQLPDRKNIQVRPQSGRLPHRTLQPSSQMINYFPNITVYFRVKLAYSTHHLESPL